jgi:hypothetical protein
LRRATELIEAAAERAERDPRRRVPRGAGRLSDVATLVLGPPPPELQALLERRRRAGLDRFEVVWDGVLHMIPAPVERSRLSDLSAAELEREIERS